MSGEETVFMEAINDVKISSATVDEIKQMLKLVMIKIGLRSQNWPSEEEKFVLREHIVSNFGGHTLREVKLAFEMAIAGHLCVDVNCFENFSCLYFSNIMTAYRSWAKQVHEYMRQSEKPLMIEDKRDLTDSEMQEWVNEWIKDFKQLKSILLIPTILYDWLTEKGEIELTNKEKNILLHETAVSIRESSLSDDPQELARFQQMKSQGYFVGQEIQRLKDIAKKAAVFNYLQKKSV